MDYASESCDNVTVHAALPHAPPPSFSLGLVGVWRWAVGLGN